MRKLNPIELLVSVMLVLALLLGLYLSIAQPEAYTSFTIEDGVAEYTTAAFFGLMALLSIFRSVAMFRSSVFKGGVTWLVLFLVCFFVFGEEISWGQRIFGSASSEFFQEYNTQEEINLHNLKFGDFSLNKMIFTYFVTAVMAIYFLVLPILVQKWAWAKKIFGQWRVPLARNYQIGLLLLSTLIVVIIKHEKNWELWEMAFALVFFLVLYRPRDFSTANELSAN